MPADVRRQLERMRSSHLDARERVAAGNALAQQGDPRFRADAWYLLDEPLLGFVEIPAGPFLMGSHKAHDPGAYDDELPQHEVTLPRYFIGRYPVTVAQFRAFVEGGGSRPENPAELAGISQSPRGVCELVRGPTILRLAHRTAAGMAGDAGASGDPHTQ